MATSVFERVENVLRDRGIAFHVLRHEPVYTSEEAARVRGTPLASGAKALVCKGEEGFVMFVVPADRKLDSHAVRKAKGWRKLRFTARGLKNGKGRSPYEAALTPDGCGAIAEFRLPHRGRDAADKAS